MHLQELLLQGTRVSGSLDVLTEFAYLEEADLASTAVTGGGSPNFRRFTTLKVASCLFLPLSEQCLS